MGFGQDTYGTIELEFDVTFDMTRIQFCTYKYIEI